MSAPTRIALASAVAVCGLGFGIAGAPAMPVGVIDHAVITRADNPSASVTLIRCNLGVGGCVPGQFRNPVFSINPVGKNNGVTGIKQCAGGDEYTSSDCGLTGSPSSSHGPVRKPNRLF